MRAVLGAVVLVVVHVVLLGVNGPAHARPDDPVGVWPLDPRPDVVRPFEPPPHPYAAGHRGVDLAGSPGQAVHASLAGTVGYSLLLTPFVVPVVGALVRRLNPDPFRRWVHA